MIRNLETGFILPQFYVLYDNRFQMANDGYEDNESISEQIWNVLVQGEEVNAVERVNTDKENLPHIYTYLLSPQKVAT